MTRADRFSAVVVLTAFGITWPVLELLGENAEFFLARRSPRLEIVALAIAGIVLMPAMVGLLASLPGRVGTWVGAGLIAIAATSLARLYISGPTTPPSLSITFALMAGGGFTWAFFRFATLRQGARYLLVAPIVLLVVFLVAMPVGAILEEPDSSVGNPVTVGNPVPVVLVVFDEFPVASIIDPSGQLRADRYPNLAELAADGVWYPNAVTVHQQTEHSVPAILTGTVPDRSLTPVTGQYPFNLFTALRTSHDLHVRESVTRLCPRQLCADAAGSAGSLVHDLGVVSGHVLLPRPLTDTLPPIDEGWGDFRRVTGEFDARGEFLDLLADGVRAPIDDMLAEIREGRGDRPPLYYLHALIPHHPWQYLPDGRSYPFVVGANPASIEGGWNDDSFLVAQSMQRHLLQVGYADYVVGELVAALKETGVYEDALVVVVADHGISIKPGVDHQRTITETTVGEIAAVPLFVKYPASSPGGVVDERRALTIDILPTVADVLDASLPGDTEGVSLLATPPDRNRTTTLGPRGAVTYDTDGNEKLAVARRIEAWFPDGDPWALRPDGTPDLVGRVVDLSTLPASSMTARLREPGLYEDVETTGPIVPSRVGAVLSGPADGTELVAVVVNGRIGSITRSYEFDDEIALLAMVDPRFFVDGANRIDFLELAGDGGLRLIDRAG